MGADAAAAMCAVFPLLVCLVGLEESLALNWNPVPRKTVRYHGKWVRKFPSKSSFNQTKLSFSLVVVFSRKPFYENSFWDLKFFPTKTPTKKKNKNTQKQIQ